MEALLILGAMFLIGVFAKSLTIIRPYQKGVVERLGRFDRILDPGLTFVLPVLERCVRVDVREKVIDVPPQDVITSDNVLVSVDAVVYYQITDPRKVMYNIDNFQMATMKLAQTNLRNVVGDLELDDTLTSREKINSALRTVLDDATDGWGVRITRVEIQRIEPPRDITDAMSQQMKAERERRAVLLEADGFRDAAIRRAEGERQSAVLRAQGDAESVRARAEAERDKRIAEATGEAEAIRSVFQAINESGVTDEVLALKYMEALQAVANGHATKIFMPMEASSMLASFGALGEMFSESQQRPSRLQGDDTADDQSQQVADQ